jgi:hypothetical protein
MVVACANVYHLHTNRRKHQVTPMPRQFQHAPAEASRPPLVRMKHLNCPKVAVPGPIFIVDTSSALQYHFHMMLGPHNDLSFGWISSGQLYFWATMKARLKVGLALFLASAAAASTLEQDQYWAKADKTAKSRRVAIFAVEKGSNHNFSTFQTIAP